MMNKSLRARGRESSRKTYYGFQLLVIPGREPCDKIDARINFAPGERTRNPDTVRGAGFRVHAKARVPE
jgi:hypothetical protein